MLRIVKNLTNTINITIVTDYPHGLTVTLTLCTLNGSLHVFNCFVAVLVLVVFNLTP